MNERIRELFNIATFEEDRMVDGVYHPFIPLQRYGQPTRYSITEEGYNKFAESIVRECADLFEVEYGNSAITGKRVCEVIKEHFGVE